MLLFSNSLRFGGRILKTKVDWNICLNKNRSASHSVNIAISNFEESDPSQSLVIYFNDRQFVSDFEAITNDHSFAPKVITDNDSEQKMSTTCEFVLSDILSFNEDNKDPQQLLIQFKFKQENAFFKAGDSYIVDMHYNCIGLNALSIDVKIFLPKLECIEKLKYYAKKIILRRKTEKIDIGVYSIALLEGTQSQETDPFWESVKAKHVPYKSFFKGGVCQFPVIGFKYSLPGKIPFLSFIIVGILGGILKGFGLQIFNRFF